MGCKSIKELERAGIIYEKEDHIFAYSRSYGCQKLVLICNFSSKEKDIELSEEARNILLALFYMNVATDKQRKQLEMFLNKKEQENLIKFDEKEFFAKKNNTYGVDKNSNRNAGSAINNVNDIKENVNIISNELNTTCESTNKDMDKNNNTALAVVNENSWTYKIKKAINKILEKLKIRK